MLTRGGCDEGISEKCFDSFRVIVVCRSVFCGCHALFVCCSAWSADFDSLLQVAIDEFVLGYSAEIAVSDDHLIVAQRVTRNATDNDSLVPIVGPVEERCGQPPGAALADSGFFSIDNLNRMEQHNIDAYAPDSDMARALNLGTRCSTRAEAPAHRRMRAKLQSPAGQAAYARRKAVVEPFFGVLKEQRGIRQFRTGGLNAVGNEFPLATLAYNITMLHALTAA